MKKNNIYLPLFLLGLLISACSKSEFDPKVDGFLTDERKKELMENVETKANLLQVELNGIYNNNIRSQSNSGETFGLKAIHLATDLSGLDMVQQSYSWFGFDYNFDMWRAEYARTAFLWNFLYKQISSINAVLTEYFPEAPSQAVLYQKYAELKSLRGIYYYYLINLYQHSYKGHENDLGVPLVLRPTDVKLPRATVAAVYEQLLADFSVVDDARYVVTETKTDVDKAVAATYLAKVYAHLEQWDKVITYTRMVLNSPYFTFTSMGEVQAAKWDISSASWLWGYDITQETTTHWNSFYSNIDNTNPISYAGGGAFKSIYSLLYAHIAPTDVRRNLYINRTEAPAVARRYPQLPDYANLKYVTDTRFLGDYCFLRLEDPLLLYIEALVERNELPRAQNTLTYFMQNFRDPYYTPTATDQASMREEVRWQRRIELWGEGTSFFDFKRWRLGANRTQAGSNHVYAIDVPAGDSRWVYQIPISEIEANPNMVQN